MTFDVKDTFPKDEDPAREYQIPVTFPMPIPLAEKLRQHTPEALHGILSYVQGKLNQVSCVLGALTLLQMRLYWDGEKLKAQEVVKRIEGLMEHVEDLLEYALQG